jgi:Entner-Doudoroff aldolase
MSAQATLERLLHTRLVAILRLDSLGDLARIVDVLVDTGVRGIELALTHPGALDALPALVNQVAGRAEVGAGTVRTVEQLRQVAAAGCSFCVSPHVDAALIAAACERDLVPVPGAFTATEVHTADLAGARLVKLFPAGELGLDVLAALRDPFPDVAFVPTGGITLDLIPRYFAVGAAAVGLGSALVPRRQPLEGLVERARRAVDLAGSGGSA